MSAEVPVAAVAILRARLPEDSVLLIRRATNPEDPWSGHWSFPGGRRDEADTDLLDTALRELAEECGIQLRREDVVETLPVTHAGRRAGKLVPVQPYTFVVEEALPVTLDPAEAEEAYWLPSRTILDPALHSRTAVPGVPPDTLFPAIPLHGVPLWGFTYRVLCSWLDFAVEE
ncbi:MAG: CoA pyrophosphatase [Acidobacteria bacterium]|nr:CoA pyrophosphatase [Acidobacteriota bacterium]